MPVTARNLLVRKVYGAGKKAISCKCSLPRKKVVDPPSEPVEIPVPTFTLINTLGLFSDDNIVVCNGTSCSTVLNGDSTERPQIVMVDGGNVLIESVSVCLVNNTNTPLYYKNNFQISWSYFPILPNQALIYGNPSPPSSFRLFFTSAP